MILTRIVITNVPKSADVKKVSLKKPGYHSENAIWIRNRDKKWEGIGAELESSLFTATDYKGKIFLKLLEDSDEPIPFAMTVRVTKSDGSKAKIYKVRNSYETENFFGRLH